MDHVLFRLLNCLLPPATPERSYIALSYCWTDNTNMPRDISKDVLAPTLVRSLATQSEKAETGLPLPSSPILYQALLNELDCPQEGI